MGVLGSLDEKLLEFMDGDWDTIDLRQDMSHIMKEVLIGDEPYLLQSGDFILASTYETIHVPRDLAARLEGKSSLGRVGLLIHSTAGYVDPGWQGKLTLELTNVANKPITLYKGMRIAQISFIRLTTPVDVPYGSAILGSKYQGQREVTPTRSHRDY